MAIQIDTDGMIIHAKVRNARSPAIERGRRTSTITGIVVHQTDAETSASSLNSYTRPKANGAHFLVDTDGTIYQTAAIYQRTNHVGPLKARCLITGKCSPRDYPAGLNAVDPMHRIEMRRAPGERYPGNMEAIGIEMVGRARLPAGFQPPRNNKLSMDELRGRYGVYDTPTTAQNQSLSWLVKALEDSMQIAPSEIFRHPEASRKNTTEAQGANWNLAVPTP
ncbi:N-acetylmuramoyl-L-alanine amidase [Variovorax paradoxus]|uniref:N-acetylmuramoyl-L-alanine amidase n=1 Tax=Variovorax paradoxus TaxID=34073 RepID=A0AA91ICJ8_VARPD|nr:N-acetylmuramoyl-L-alanine amidase [Variovorax paradoxus]OAK66206.1 N-acetylmuramoyl-L-alanine amidase [Variovorax paradoxus]